MVLFCKILKRDQERVCCLGNKNFDIIFPYLRTALVFRILFDLTSNVTSLLAIFFSMAMTTLNLHICGTRKDIGNGNRYIHVFNAFSQDKRKQVAKSLFHLHFKR